MTEQKAKAIVLEWLISEAVAGDGAIDILGILSFGYLDNSADPLVISAYETLSTKAEYELLAEFAAWGLKEGATNEQ